MEINKERREVVKMGGKERVKSIREIAFLWDLLFSLLGFLLARITIGDGLQVFGLSYLLALLFYFKEIKILPSLLVLLGYLSIAGVGLPLILLLVLYISLYCLYNLLPSVPRLSLVVLFSLLILILLEYLFRVEILYGFSFHSFLLLLLSYIFRKALEGLHLLADGEELREVEALSLFLLLSLPLLSLSWQIGEILLLTLLFFFSLYGGISLGTAAGTLWVFSFFLINTPTTDLLFYPFLGFFCGLLRQKRQLGLGLGYLLASLSIQYIDKGELFLDSSMIEGLLALILFTIMDFSSTLFLKERVERGVKEKDIGGREEIEEYSRRLEELGDCFFHFNREMTMEEKEIPGLLLNHFVREVCSSCQLLSLCKGDGLIYQDLLIPLFTSIQRGTSPPKALMEENLRDCPYPHKIRGFVEEYLKKMEGEESKDGLVVMKEILSLLLYGLGEGLQVVGEDHREREKREKREKESLLEYGIASLHREEISGDSYLIESLPGGRELVALSDGLGTGPRASLMSRHVLHLLAKLLGLGIKEEDALHILNLFCLLSYTDEEYTTLDLAIFSPSFSRVTLYKYGAASTFIKRGLQISSICSRSLPLGVLSSPGRWVQRRLKAEDQVILVTDGILEVCREDTVKEEWLLHSLKDLSYRHPQDLAEKILHMARGKTSSLLDDMTVIVISQGNGRNSF